MSIREQVDSLKALVLKEVNENKIVESGEEVICSLRSAWRSNKNSFSDCDVDTIKELKRKIKAIKKFIEEKRDFPDVLTKEEAEEAVGRLYSIVEKVDGLQVSGRINKEIRELIERKSNLPSQAVTQRTSELRRAMASLSSRSPTCIKCDSNMVLREGNSDFFWGCSIFPQCWRKKRLTKEELRMLPN